MRVVKGNKTEELNKVQLDELVKEFKNVVIDLGTGDGRFVYKSALEDEGTLYIGIDPSEKQLEIYSKKANRKKLKNVLFVLGSIEQLPDELNSIADKIFIILPWGSLLEAIVRPTKESVENLVSMLKKEGDIEILFGYHKESEPGETERLDLPEINEKLIEEEIYPVFSAFGNFSMEVFERLEKEDLKNIETTWGKKLTFGKDRPIFLINFRR